MSLATFARVLAAAPVLLTVLPLSRTGRGWVRIWDFPRPQIAALGLLGGAALWRFAPRTRRDGVLGAALGASLLYHAARMAPYTPVFPRQVPTAGDAPPDCRLRLLMANVLQENRRSDLLMDAIADADPDVICLVETNGWWVEALRPLHEQYAWRQECPLENHYGMCLFSRLPITACEVRHVVTGDVPSIRAVVRLRRGEAVTIYAVHPPPPLPGSPTYGRDAELVMTGLEIEKAQRPAIIVGDLNDVAWSYTTRLFQRLSHMVDPRVGRGMFNTFHAEHPLARYPLDHVFHTRDFSLKELRRLRYIGSDHFPILAELAFTPERKAEAAAPSPTSGDLENAGEMIEDAQTSAPYVDDEGRGRVSTPPA